MHSEVRKARNNHSDERVSQLLAVPRYAALLREEGDSEDVNSQHSHGSFLINNRKKWHAQHDKWIEEACRFDELSAGTEEGTKRRTASYGVIGSGRRGENTG